MKYDKKIYISIFWVLLGAILILCTSLGKIDDFWSGMGAGVLVIGILQIARQIRYRIDFEYREEVDTNMSDERNRYIANKAWAWAGYTFVIISAAAIIVMKVAGRDELIKITSGGVCLIVLLYWIFYHYLRRKY
ncbi:MAG: hypothetical protein PUE13_09435 [Clostridiales bacterium]|nr:hypothetical protein [Clostridiales bacterium]